MKTALYAIALFMLWSLYYLIPIEYRLLWQPDETRYAEISRAMLVSRDWVVPYFLDIRYFEKPVAGYWLNSLSQWLFGHSNFAVRFGAVLSTTLTAGLVAWLTQRIWQDKQVTRLSVVIYLSCFLVYGVGTYAVLDPMIALWLCLAMCSFWYAAQSTTGGKKAVGYLLLGVACGLGVMTKGFLALVVPFISILLWVIIEGRWRELLLYGPLTVISAVCVVLPWAWQIAQREPDFWHYFFWVEHIQRLASDNAQHKAPIWYFIPVLLLGTLPWLGYLSGALRVGWQHRKQNSGTVYLLCWVLMPLLFFSLAKGKLLTYILPCFAPLAALLAYHVRRATSSLSAAVRINGGINVVFGISGMVMVLCLLAPMGVASAPVYTPQEFGKVVLLLLIFFFWALLGYLSQRAGGKQWWLAAGCPLAMVLLVGLVIPQRVIDAKQPQAMIDNVKTSLSASRYILADSVGVASGIAWELQRSDILLYGNQGELRCGLQFADRAARFVSRQDFAAWLAAHRDEGNVTVVLLLSADEALDMARLPMADRVYQQGRFFVLEYHTR